jgi:hypothetical protein
MAVIGAAPMPSEAQTFLEALFAGKPDAGYLLIWTLPEMDSRWFRLVEDANRCVESLSGQDLYVGVGLAGKDYGLKRRCLSNDIAGIVGLWADLDL